MDSISPFSFFNLIFLPRNGNHQMIIEHETTHVKQFHWVDLILMEIVSVLLWFNPFVILYKNALKLQHEYLADTSVIKDKNRIETYLNCMLKQVQVVSCNGITSQFYCKTIKKRIVMITKNKTSNKYLGVYLLALPLVCFMLFVNGCKKAPKNLNETVNVTLKDTIQTQKSQSEVADVSPVNEEIFTHVEQMPQFPGGEKALMEFLSKNIKYPEIAQQKGIQGTVVLRFVVDKTGKITNNVTKLRSLDPSCDEEAIRVIKLMPKWKPGKQKGEAVPVYYTLPVRFRLQK